MTLAELKQLMGIALEDTSQDAILSLYLDTAMDAAKAYVDKVDWSASPLNLPATVKLGIVRYVELSQQRKENAGIQSESIGGMTQTFRNGNTDDNYFAEVFDIWSPYHTVKNGLVFRSARKAYPVRVSPPGAWKL